MKYGLFGIGSGSCADPAIAGAVAQAAEQSGFESVWTGEHVVLPDPRQAPSPAPPQMPMLHPSTILAYLAGLTRTIKLGTGVVLIAQRNPLVLAKEIASLDVVTGGRLLFGIGAGYLHQEFDALGADFANRGARTDEAIQILRVMWREAAPRFDGRFHRFANINAFPRPVQTGGPRIVIGGTSPSAIRRTVATGSDWYGFALDPAQTRGVMDALKAEQARQKREAAIEISVTPRAPLTPQLRDEYAAIGVHRLIPMLPQGNQAQLLEQVAQLANSLGIRQGG